MQLLRTIARELRNEWRLGRSYVGLKLSASKNLSDRLELGSGPVLRPGWVTVDMAVGADIYWDLNRPLPFADNRFAFIYSSHVIEHFDHRQMAKLLRQIYRVTQPGGTVSFCVPDTRIFLEIYRTKSDPGALLDHKPAVSSSRPLDVLNYIFYMGGEHKHMFEPDNLAYHLMKAGFVDCRERAFDAKIDAEERRSESFYMDCSKT